jgi:hypothetical protein
MRNSLQILWRLLPIVLFITLSSCTADEYDNQEIETISTFVKSLNVQLAGVLEDNDNSKELWSTTQSQKNQILFENFINDFETVESLGKNDLPRYEELFDHFDKTDRLLKKLGSSEKYWEYKFQNSEISIAYLQVMLVLDKEISLNKGIGASSVLINEVTKSSLFTESEKDDLTSRLTAFAAAKSLSTQGYALKYDDVGSCILEARPAILYHYSLGTRAGVAYASWVFQMCVESYG